MRVAEAKLYLVFVVENMNNGSGLFVYAERMMQ